jgi:hypothetical protein
MRIRRTFSDVKEAKNFAWRKNIEYEKYGPRDIYMPDRFWVQAGRAHELLRPFGESLLEVVREYVTNRERCESAKKQPICVSNDEQVEQLESLKSKTMPARKR